MSSAPPAKDDWLPPNPKCNQPSRVKHAQRSAISHLRTAIVDGKVARSHLCPVIVAAMSVQSWQMQLLPFCPWASLSLEPMPPNVATM